MFSCFEVRGTNNTKGDTMINVMRVFVCVSVFVLFVQLDCKDTLIDPPIKNPREYTWTIDTLAYPGSFQTLMGDMWASSPSDVYVVGHNDQAFGKMYHYDGKGWTPVNTPFGAIDLGAIYGFSANDIWAVGERIDYNPTPPPNFLDSSLIIHFDGSRWTEYKVIGGRHLQTV
jgi:hypothetical protein